MFPLDSRGQKKQFSQMLESSKVQDRFQKEIIDSIPQNDNPTLVTEKIEKIFLDIARESLTPKKNVTMKLGQKPHCNKWIDETCFKAKRDFLKEKKEFLKFSGNMGKRLIFINVKKRCKRMHCLTERAFRERNPRKVAQLCDRDPKSFWSSVKSLLRDTLEYRGSCIHSNSWRYYFKSLLNSTERVSNKLGKVREELTKFEKEITGKIGPLDIIFTESEIINTIKSRKLNKSNFGVISNEMLKCNPKAISKVLCHLFNFILHRKVKYFQKDGICL